MTNAVDFSGRPFHFIGIGGIGMSALAYILARRSLPVSGSDVRLSHITQRLQDEGVHIFWSQDASNLEFFQATQHNLTPSLASSPDLNHNGQTNGHSTNAVTPEETLPSVLPQVICSTAIHTNNSEYQAALELGCPIFHRSDVLAALIHEYKSIAVAGTHGKTTTSSMIGHLLLEAGLDPTIVVGGEVATWQGNAYLGQGDYLVAEADESDGSLAKLSAHIGVITNIELDHLDHYSSLDEVIGIFQAFSQQCKLLVASLDCATVQAQLKPDVTYSLRVDSGADYVAKNASYHAQGTQADIWERGEYLGQLNLGLLGEHNLSNALAAIAVGRLAGLDFAVIAQVLATFQGARRRFERRGYYNHILFVDDYAHHPSEIRVTLAAAQLRLTENKTPPNGRVIAIFQPHRYSRTVALLPEFTEAFNDADCVIVTNIYSAGEANTYNISGEQVAEAIAQKHPCVTYQPTLDDVQTSLKDLLQPGDLALFLGAGNLNQIIPDVMSLYAPTPAEPLQNAC